MRERVISEIRRIHAELGVAPGSRTFQQHSGIAEKEWRGKIWARWGDALKEAGLEANSLSPRLSDETILLAVAKAALAFGKMPTQNDLRIFWRDDPTTPSVTTLKSHFPRWGLLTEAIREWVRSPENQGYAKIEGMLPAPVQTIEQPLENQKYGHVYLLRAGGYYKIGQSSDLEKRVKSINVALPDKATLEHAISTDDPPGIEAYWHRRFADRRANGEWFKLSKADVLAFKKRKFQ